MPTARKAPKAPTGDVTPDDTVTEAAPATPEVGPLVDLVAGATYDELIGAINVINARLRG